MDQQRKIDAFHGLHGAGCFVIPNPWDRGSARLLASLGFRALATSSAAHGFGLGRPDTPTSLGVDEVIDHVREIAAATDLPVNADLQAGYGATPAEVAASVTRCIEAGAAGLSIEDATGDPDQPLYDLEVAVARVRAAREAIDAGALPVVLTGRAECFLVGHPDPLAASLDRLVAYAEAGADCLFAPGVRRPDDIARIVEAVAPRPVNVLAVDPGMTVASLAELGVRRVSVGSALARVAWKAAMAAAADLATTGTFGYLHDAAPFAELNALFAAPESSS